MGKRILSKSLKFEVSLLASVRPIYSGNKLRSMLTRSRMRLTGSNTVNRNKKISSAWIFKKYKMMAGTMQMLSFFLQTKLKQRLDKPTAYSIGWETLAVCMTFSSWSCTCSLIHIKASSKQTYSSRACFASCQPMFQEKTSKGLTRSSPSITILSSKRWRGTLREFNEWVSSFTASASDLNRGKTTARS